MTTPATPGVRDPADRYQRPCELCGTYDTHPRHCVYGEGGTVSYRHFDCCHKAGCLDGSCGHHLRFSGKAHGDDLVAYLHSEPGRKVAGALNSRVSDPEAAKAVLGENLWGR